MCALMRLECNSMGEAEGSKGKCKERKQKGRDRGGGGGALGTVDAGVTHRVLL